MSAGACKRASVKGQMCERVHACVDLCVLGGNQEFFSFCLSSHASPEVQLFHRRARAFCQLTEGPLAMHQRGFLREVEVIDPW